MDHKLEKMKTKQDGCKRINQLRQDTVRVTLKWMDQWRIDAGPENVELKDAAEQNIKYVIQLFDQINLF